jgi:hypothetical protein
VRRAAALAVALLLVVACVKPRDEIIQMPSGGDAPDAGEDGAPRAPREDAPKGPR